MTINKNRCMFLDENHQFTKQECEIPEPAQDEILVKIAANGICGSDIQFYSEGKLGNFVVTKPYIPGHEASGTVAGMGSAVTGFNCGDRVVIEPGIPCGRCEYCKSGRYNLCPDVVFLSAPPINGTFCDYICVRSDFVYKLPDNIPLDDAALAEPAAVAVHSVNRAGLIGGKTGLIFGMGPIGLLTLQAFKAAGGGKVYCVDIMDNRLELAAKLGADEVINPKNYPGLSNLADIVFETAGSPATTSQLFTAARVGATIVQVGWPAGNIVKMNIADFLDKELDYVAVNRYANAYPAAIQYISDGRINVKPLITNVYDFEDTPEAFKFAKENPDKVIKILVKNR
jgi:L-iditol 2-dehydrogenase